MQLIPSQASIPREGGHRPPDLAHGRPRQEGAHVRRPSRCWQALALRPNVSPVIGPPLNFRLCSHRFTMSGALANARVTYLRRSSVAAIMVHLTGRSSIGNPAMGDLREPVLPPQLASRTASHPGRPQCEALPTERLLDRTCMQQCRPLHNAEGRHHPDLLQRRRRHRLRRPPIRAAAGVALRIFKRFHTASQGQQAPLGRPGRGGARRRRVARSTAQFSCPPQHPAVGRNRPPRK